MSKSPCQACKDWKECKAGECSTCGMAIAGIICPNCGGRVHPTRKEWFHYGEIRWCPHQILWLLKNDEAFNKECKWPLEPKRAEQVGKHTLKADGYFVAAKTIIGELNKRMKTTGTAGKLLQAQAKVGESLETLDPEARDVLIYLKGSNRKKMDFNAWQRQKRYRKMTTKA